MREELFQKLTIALASKYTKDELAEKLVQRKDQRVSNLIANAFNKKVSVERLGSVKPDIYSKEYRAGAYYDFINRVFGPESWIYKYIDEQPWRLFKEKYDSIDNEVERLNFVFASYTKWQEEINKSKKMERNRYKWIDDFIVNNNKK